MYIIPYVEKRFENYNEYNVGDIIEYSNNGVDRWVVVEKEYWNDSSLVLIPETPIELVIESVDDNIGDKANQIIESFSNDVYVCGNYFNRFETDNLPNLIPNFLNQQTERIILPTGCCYNTTDCKITYSGGPPNYSYESGEFNQLNYSDAIYTEQGPKPLGYRPVVTLKVKEELQDKDKKEISTDLKVGDNVKYEAKGYKNWKVLSIDKDNNTVDIISGGIVKNITLSGKEDWDKYEDIIQREVDEYKNGDKAKKATTVTSSHLKTLKEIDKSILSRYWILSKNTTVKQTVSVDNKNADLIYYYIGVINLYKNDNFDKYISNIAIYADFKGNQGIVEYYNNDGYYTNEINQSSYTAGLRPIITLKLDSVEKLLEEDTKKIEESTEKQEKVFIKEQESKNKDYKGPSKVDDSTSSTGNNNEVKSNDNDNKKDNITDNNTSNVEKIVYKDKPFYKYGFYILLVICLIETLMLIIPKINKK